MRWTTPSSELHLEHSRLTVEQRQTKQAFYIFYFPEIDIACCPIMVVEVVGMPDRLHFSYPPTTLE
jgi:hypothetical protein